MTIGKEMSLSVYTGSSKIIPSGLDWWPSRRLALMQRERRLESRRGRLKARST
jgi:hypothetical protein